MKSVAAVFHKSDQPFELVSLQIPSLTAGQVLVKVTCCTLCGSDLHTICGDRPVTGATILGHEMIGVVEDVSAGAGVCDVNGQPIVVGDRVTWSVAASCGECYFCLQELPQKCEQLFKYGHEPLSEHSPASGGLAEHCLLVSGTAIVKLPEALPDFVACPANCATATVAAALRTAGSVEGKSVLIHGGGMLGMTMAAMSRAHGVSDVFVTDMRAVRLRWATRFGATEALDAADSSAIQRAIYRATNGRGADIIVEMSGASTAAERSIELLRVGGRLILVGSVFPAPAISVSPEHLVRNMIRIEGVHNYLPTDLVTAIRFLETYQSEFPFHELVSGEYDLSEIDLAVVAAKSGSMPRIAVRPSLQRGRVQ